MDIWWLIIKKVPRDRVQEKLRKNKSQFINRLTPPEELES